MTDRLRILVLGGTSWLGGTVASIAVGRGHEVSCLARGESGSVPLGARHVRADRWQADAYDVVSADEWDAVIDVSWQPELVRSALTELAPRARHWIYVSSVSVYADHSAPEADESSALLSAWSGSGAAAAEEYGEAKVSCETTCAELFDPARLLVARAGLIVGYGDRSDRFGYWAGRFARATDDDRVLVPAMDMPVQVIDVVDLAAWLVRGAEEKVAGTYDAVGRSLPFSEMSAACAAVTGVDPDLVEVGEDWLMSTGVAPWAGPESLPLWLPNATHGGMQSRTGKAARAASLGCRPLTETVADCLRWEQEQGLDRDRRAGLTPAREAELLEQWDSATPAT
jgi:nucleoside-diphosphate-sugar epimerase